LCSRNSKTRVKTPFLPRLYPYFEKFIKINADRNKQLDRKRADSCKRCRLHLLGPFLSFLPSCSTKKKENDRKSNCMRKRQKSVNDSEQRVAGEERRTKRQTYCSKRKKRFQTEYNSVEPLRIDLMHTLSVIFR